MALKILKSTDPIAVEQVVILLFGQPGIGKTSTGYTAEDPLLLDFDGGAHRSGFRKDTVRVENWAEVAKLSPEDLEPYKTIVVDTGGRALDKLTEHIIRTDPKKGTRSGTLSIQGFGDLKVAFSTWASHLRELGKDLVLLAHDLEDKKGDTHIVRPDFQGGSKHEVVKVADAVGYMYQDGENRILDFNPSDSWIGKNCCGVGPFKIPDFKKNPKFLANVIAKMKGKLNERTAEQAAAAQAVEEWKSNIDEATSADDFTALVPVVQGADETIRENVKRILFDVAKDKGFAFDQESGAFAANREQAQAAG